MCGGLWQHISIASHNGQIGKQTQVILRENSLVQYRSMFTRNSPKMGQTHHHDQKAFSIIACEVGSSHWLPTELLDVSKIQAGRLEYVWETVNLDALLREVAETMQQMSATHTIVVRGTPAGSLVGDQDRLEQVFTNLLSNAIKYAPDAPLIEMEVSRSTETVTIRVRDQGIGIEQREKIFERFYRAFDPSRRAVPGLGMGLYIAVEIVKGHGGTITVDSEVGKGLI
jgi:signal transduction histidine kinase